MRKSRGRVLKQLGQEKNAAFRRQFVGKTLSAVTIENGKAVTSNYLTVEMSTPRPSRQVVDLQIGAVSEAGLKESAPFLVLAF